ncbi:hypothetical protein [Nitrosomonas sp.]|uniref:hypothetical protein n=1 Tax=Nitrosomonas sp. TaxID=42353 RepID=UPI001D51057A|nr:hypothetical protein [Nitrosomonas sp.]MBX3618131.1 hypothetical protein [Nitrosomonas sp.]
MPTGRIPYWLELAVSAMTEFVTDYMVHTPPMASRSVEIAHYPMHFDCSKAIHDLGLPRNSVRQAVAGEIEWLLDNGLIMWHLPLLREI